MDWLVDYGAVQRNASLRALSTGAVLNSFWTNNYPLRIDKVVVSWRDTTECPPAETVDKFEKGFNPDGVEQK